jgi:hypothetical protein
MECTYRAVLLSISRQSWKTMEVHIMFTKSLQPPRTSRTGASAYLFEKYGIKRSPSTLAKYASIGGGPSYRKIGKREVAYDFDALDSYAETLLGKEARHAAEHFSRRPCHDDQTDPLPNHGSEPSRSDGILP